MSEHGEEAAIAAVNRIRSGGVAGFFCREEFEVIVDPGGEAAVGAGSDEAEDASGYDRADGSERAEETIAEAIGRGVDDRPPARLAWRGQANAPDVTGTHNPIDEPDAIDEPGPATTAEPVSERGVEPSVFGGPVPPGTDGARDRFLALLERRLDETSAVEDDVLLRRSRPTTSRAEDRAAAPVAPAPRPTTTSTPEHVGPRPTIGITPDRARPMFWRRLDRVRDELASFLPNGSHRTAVVGPLPLASAVVNRLQSAPGMASAAVIALTDRAGIVSEPTWRLERNGDRVIRAMEEAEGRPMIVVIDVPPELPPWVGSLQRRLRTVGVGLFRYAVPGQPTGADLERYRQGGDVPYAIDLTSRVEPGLVVGFIAERHPVISVAGADLGPELLLALRRHIGASEPQPEPLIDG